jgi:hypothetical protein
LVLPLVARRPLGGACDRGSRRANFWQEMFLVLNY